MLVKTVELKWKLSDDNKKTIKENAQKIKNFLATIEYDTCAEFYDECCSSDDTFFKYIEDLLPFVKEEKDYISEGNIDILIDEIDSAIKNVKPYITKIDFAEKQDIMDFIVNKYDEVELIEKIIDYSDEKFLNKLLNE